MANEAVIREKTDSGFRVRYIFYFALVLLAFLPDLLPNPFAGILIAVGIYAVGGGLIEVLISPIMESCPTDNKEQAKWAKFKVEEAICDNNEVYISIAVTATDAKNTLLIPTNMAEGDNMSDLGLKGEDGNISAEQYAKKYGKTNLKDRITMNFRRITRKHCRKSGQS